MAETLASTPQNPPPVYGYIGGMPQGGTVQQTMPASTTVMPPANDAPGLDVKQIALPLAESGAWMAANVKGLGAPGALAGTAISMVGADYSARKSIDQMIAQYRDVVAGELGMAPEAVDEAALRKVAAHNKIIGQGLREIDGEKSQKPVTGLVSGGVGLAVGALGGPLGMIASIPVCWAADKVASSAYQGLNGTDGVEHSAHAAIQALSEKQSQGVPITAEDVFEVFARGYGDLGHEVSNRMGDDIAKLSPEEKQRARQHSMLSKGCEQIAAMINAGRMSLGALTQVNPRQLTGQAPVALTSAPTVLRTANENMPPAAGFVQREMQRRQAATLQPKAVG